MTDRESAPFINPEADYYLELPAGERRKLGYALSFISEADKFRFAQRQRQNMAKPQAASPEPGNS